MRRLRLLGFIMSVSLFFVACRGPDRVDRSDRIELPNGGSAKVFNWTTASTPQVALSAGTDGVVFGTYEPLEIVVILEEHDARPGREQPEVASVWVYPEGQYSRRVLEGQVHLAAAPQNYSRRWFRGTVKRPVALGGRVEGRYSVDVEIESAPTVAVRGIPIRIETRIP